MIGSCLLTVTPPRMCEMFDSCLLTVAPPRMREMIDSCLLIVTPLPGCARCLAAACWQCSPLLSGCVRWLTAINCDPTPRMCEMIDSCLLTVSTPRGGERRVAGSTDLSSNTYGTSQWGGSTSKGTLMDVWSGIVPQHIYNRVGSAAVEILYHYANQHFFSKFVMPYTGQG